MITIEKKLEVLSKIAEQFNKAGIKWAVGASLLLYLKGYVDDFHDIDLLICEKDALAAKERMMEIGELQGRKGYYRSNHFYVFLTDGVEVDIMGGYTVTKDGVDYEIALEKEAELEWITINGQEIPLDSIPRWRRHYDVMGRQGKVDVIDRGNVKTNSYEL